MAKSRNKNRARPTGIPAFANGYEGILNAVFLWHIRKHEWSTFRVPHQRRARGKLPLS